MVRILFVVFILVTGITVSARGVCLQVFGIVEFDRAGLQDVSIIVVNNSQIEHKIKTDLRGKFSINLEKDKTYVLEISKEGFYKQKVTLNTFVSFYGEWDYKFYIDMIPKIDNLSADLFNNPIGMINYNKITDRFENDIDPNILQELKAFMVEYERLKITKYKGLIANADAVFVKMQYDKAIELYEQAIIIDSYSNYPYIQLDMIKRIKVQDKRFQLRYDKNVQLADEYYDAKNYKKAKRLYEKSLQFKDDDYPKEQLAKIIKIISLKEVLAVQ